MVNGGAPDFVFVVTYGRTGSTLLQGLLNADPAARVLGENMGALYHLYAAERATELAAAFAGTEAAHAPFFGAAALERAEWRGRVRELARHFLESRRAGARLLGFKEIRYDVPDLDEYLRWLGEVFPRAFFVLLTRQLEEVIHSGFWRGAEPAFVADKVRYIERVFSELQAAGEINGFAIDFEDLVIGGPKLEALFANLGLVADPNTIGDVLTRPHSYDQRTVCFFFDGSRLQLRSNVLAEHFLAHWLQPVRIDAGARGLHGALVTRAPKAVLTRLSLVREGSPEQRVEGELGLPSRGMAQRFPDRPKARHARFRLTWPPGDGLWRLIAEVDGEPVELGTLLVQARIVSSFPN